MVRTSSSSATDGSLRSSFDHYYFRVTQQDAEKAQRKLLLRRPPRAAGRDHLVRRRLHRPSEGSRPGAVRLSTCLASPAGQLAASTSADGTSGRITWILRACCHETYSSSTPRRTRTRQHWWKPSKNDCTTGAGLREATRIGPFALPWPGCGSYGPSSSMAVWRRTTMAPNAATRSQARICQTGHWHPAQRLFQHRRAASTSTRVPGPAA